MYGIAILAPTNPTSIMGDCNSFHNFPNEIMSHYPKYVLLYRLMKLEFPSHAQHLSFEKFRKCNLCNSYRKLFKQVHVYINYIFLIKISKNKKKMYAICLTQ